MRLLLCAATEFEIRPVLEWIAREKINDIEVLITGVGLTATTYSLTKKVLTRKPDFMLQAGVAGCLDHNLPLTKIVLVENENIGDLGVEEKGKFRSLFDLQLLNMNEYPWTNGKLANNMGTLKDTGLTIVDAVSVNEVSTSQERITYYKKQLGASIESMEGAAFHYVALMERIPFLQVRSLSNFAGERDKTRWVLDMAVIALNIDLQKILLKLKHP